MLGAHRVAQDLAAAGINLPALAAIDELCAVDPRPAWMAATGRSTATLDTIAVGLIDAGAVSAADVMLAEARRSDIARALSRHLLDRRDQQTDQLLRGAAPAIERALADALSAAEDAQRDAEIAMQPFGISTPWRTEQGAFDDAPSIVFEPVDLLRQQASLAGSVALAAFERWHAAYARRKQLRDLVLRLRRGGVLSGDSAALAQANRWPRTDSPEEPTGLDRVKAALARAKAKREASAA